MQKVALLARAIFSESFLLVSTRKGSLHNPLNKLFSLKCFLFLYMQICSCSWIYICIYISKRGFHIPENVSVFVCVFDQLRVRKSIYTSIYLFFLTLLVFYVCTVYTHDMVFCFLYIVYTPAVVICFTLLHPLIKANMQPMHLDILKVKGEEI